ncbi:ribbon-helix-helix domain-containing protein [Synechococcus sp. PCC 7336]|uniref:ribbon-helix-helix domain-containing protein n=1 Tax=Synechococcus sp. PCC 7336 TaxID=195250 RepID=UPI001D0D0C5C|nr:ribbon-helix-helix domain-containing protein [Synechococcus sp. PCC 7336]
MAQMSSSETTRTTLSLPSELIEATDRAIRAGKARSRNELVARALRHELAILKQEQIDAEFAAMAEDLDYREECLEMCEEFAVADWEAFKLNERS